MRRPAAFLAAFAVVALALAPALAEARAGRGGSFGSRGSQTFSAPPRTQTAPAPARPVERSMTEPARPGTAAGQPGAAARAPGAAAVTGGFFSRNPLMAGLMGGLLGAGLFGLLSGHGLFGGMAGLAGFFGLLLQIALIAGLVWLVLRLVRGSRAGAQRPAYAGGPPPGDMPGGMAGGMARDMGGRDAGARGPGGGGGRMMGGSAGPGAGTVPLTLAADDFQAFEGLLKGVNEAWSRQDLGALQRIATPEMVQYFADDLADLSGQGLRNETQDVVLEQGDLAEAWREGRREYATVAMRFSMVDVTRRIADGALVEGDPARRTEATELWTFMRSSGGGSWMLSAIQQSG